MLPELLGKRPRDSDRPARRLKRQARDARRGAATFLGPEHDLWTLFSRAGLAGWLVIVRDVDMRSWSYTRSGSPEAIDCETVFLTDMGEFAPDPSAAPDGTARPAIPIQMRRTDAGFHVLGVGLDQSLVD